MKKLLLPILALVLIACATPKPIKTVLGWPSAAEFVTSHGDAKDSALYDTIFVRGRIGQENYGAGQMLRVPARPNLIREINDTLTVYNGIDSFWHEPYVPSLPGASRAN